MTLLRRELGDVLRERRRAQGRTLREVSATASVSLGYLSEVERGEKEASSELLASICGALELPLSQVLIDVSSRMAESEGLTAPVPLRVRTERRRRRRLTPSSPGRSHRPDRSRVGPALRLPRCLPLTPRPCRPRCPPRTGSTRSAGHDPAGGGGGAVVSVWWGDLDGHGPLRARRPPRALRRLDDEAAPRARGAATGRCAASSTPPHPSRCTTASRPWPTGRSFAMDEDDDQDPETWAALGGTRTVTELVEHAITRSGNLATNLLLDRVGSRRGGGGPRCGRLLAR